MSRDDGSKLKLTCVECCWKKNLLAASPSGLTGAVAVSSSSVESLRRFSSLSCSEEAASPSSDICLRLFAPTRSREREDSDADRERLSVDLESMS